MEKYELETLYSKKEKNYFTFNHVVSTYAIFFYNKWKLLYEKSSFIYFRHINISAVSFFVQLAPFKTSPKVGDVRRLFARLHCKITWSTVYDPFDLSKVVKDNLTISNKSSIVVLSNPI